MSTVFYAAFGLLWILVALQEFFLLGLGRIVVRGAENGGPMTVDMASVLTKPAPSFRAHDISGNVGDSDDFVGHMTALLFVSPSCPSCTLTLHEMAALRQKTEDHVIVVSRATEQETMAMVESHDLSVPVVTDEWGNLVKLFGIASFPSAVLINEKREVQSIGHPLRNDAHDASNGATAKHDATDVQALRLSEYPAEASGA